MRSEHSSRLPSARKNGVELRLLRHFTEVVRRGSINAAAIALGITQPGVTRSIKSLEHHYGCSLLERGPSGARATAIGRKVYENALSIFNEVNKIDRDVEALKAGGSGEVTIGVSTNFAGHYIPEAIAKVVNEYPRVKVTIRDGFFEDLTPPLRTGEVDFVFSIFPTYYREVDLQYEALLEMRTSVFARVAHPLAGRSVTRKMLSEARWTFSDQTHVTRYQEGIFTRHNLPVPEIPVITKSLVAVNRLLLMTDLIAAAPDYLFAQDVRDGKLARLKLSGVSLSNKAGLVTARDRKLSGAALLLAKTIRATMPRKKV